MTFTDCMHIFQKKIFCFKEMLNGKVASLETIKSRAFGFFFFFASFFLFLPKEKEKSGTMDQYAFVKNSPMNFTDPSGNFAALGLIAGMGAVLTAIVGFMQFVAGVAAIAAGISVIGNALGVSPIQVVAAIGFIVAGIFSLGFGFAAAGVALSLASPEFAKAFLYLGVSIAAIVVGILLLPLGPIAFILGATLIGFGIGSAVGYLSGGLEGVLKEGKWDQDGAENRWVSYGGIGAAVGFAVGAIHVLFPKFFPTIWTGIKAGATWTWQGIKTFANWAWEKILRGYEWVDEMWDKSLFDDILGEFSKKEGYYGLPWLAGKFIAFTQWGNIFYSWIGLNAINKYQSDQRDHATNRKRDQDVLIPLITLILVCSRQGNNCQL